MCRAASPSLAASLGPLAYLKYVASLSLVYRFYLVRDLSELTLDWFHHIILGVNPLAILLGFVIFLSPAKSLELIGSLGSL